MLLESFVQCLSGFRIAIVVVLLYAVYSVCSAIVTEFKIRRLGGHARSALARAPYSVDWVWQAVQHGRRHENLQFWDKNFMGYGHTANPYTLEMKPSGKRVIFTADPENIKAILATQFNDYGKGANFHRDFREFLGDSIFNSDHETWHQSRQLIRPQFIKDRVSDLDTFEKHMSILLPMLGGNGRVVDVKDLFFKYTLDAATDFLLGRSVESLEKGETEFAYAFAEIQRIQNNIARAGSLSVFISKTEFRKHLKTLNNFVQPYIKSTLGLSQDELENRSKGDEGYTFLHALASYTRDETVLRDQLVAVLLAGRDTTACTLSWAFYELSLRPDLVSELREEIHAVVGFDRHPTYADLKNMKLLQNIMNETLRLYPVVPFNVREALHDTTLPHGGGADGNSPVGVLKGTPVGYSTHYMQLSQQIYNDVPENFTDPLAFDPHRWFTWQPKPWTYIPFNGGPRLCVGQQFALTEMGYTIVRILQRFSRIECRVPPAPPETIPREKGATAARGSSIVGLRGDGRSNVMRMAQSRQLRYKSEIVLQPLDPVPLAFY